jgi:3-demethoxyubiquinol 3-hydroxylase
MSSAPASPGNPRHYSPVDRLLGQLDQALRTLAADPPAHRPSPAEQTLPPELEPRAQSRVAALMRVNHAGEIAAQALYYGQSVTAASESTRAALLKSAEEEGDHLAWCAERIADLGGHTSYLNPFWYAGSFAIGAVAGLAGDRISLGFVAETERQVEEHLTSHLARLPAEDAPSRAIIEQMKSDEREHGLAAVSAGGQPLPGFIRQLMRATARIMTSTSYWV